MQNRQAITIAIAAILLLGLAVFAISAQARTTTHEQTDTEIQPAASLTTEPPEPLEFVDQIGGRMTALEIQGDYLYVGIGPRLVILDVSDRTDPQRLGQTEPLPGAIARLSVQGNLVFTANGEGGLLIIDVENPATPQEIGSYPGNVSDVEVDGDVAYLASTEGLISIDVSDPTSPQQLDFLDIDFSDRYSSEGRIALEGNIILVTYGSILRTIDVSDPINISILAEIDLRENEGSRNIMDVVASEDYAYITVKGYLNIAPGYFHNMGYISIYDVSDPASPQRTDGVATGEWYTYAPDSPLVTGLAYAENSLYVISIGELYIIDVSDPSDAIVAGLFDTPISMAVAADENYAYVSSYIEGIEIVDVQNPSQVSRISTYLTLPQLGGEGDTIFDDPYLYVSDIVGFSILNFARREELNLVGAFHLPDQYAVPSPIDYRENYVYLGGGRRGYWSLWAFTRLSIVDVSNRLQPSLIGFYDDMGAAYGGEGPARTVKAKQDYVFVSNGETLSVIDVSFPESPETVHIGSCGLGADDVNIQNDTMYVTGTHWDLCIFDVNNPSETEFLGYYDNEGHASHVYVHDQYAWLSMRVNLHDYHLGIIDVEDPTAPYKAGEYETSSMAKVIDVIGNQAYVAEEHTLLVLDISDPINPVEIVSYETPGPAARVREIGAYLYVYVADDEKGLWVFRMPVDGGPRTLESRQTDNPPTIDGDLSDWPATSETILDLPTARNVIGVRPSGADVSASFRSLWTESMLYFAVKIIDNRLVADSEKVWEDDAIEIALDALHDYLPGGVDDHQYTTTVDGRTADFGSPDDSYIAAVQTRIDGWNLEVALPVGNFGLARFNEGQIMGFNLGLIDDDTGGNVDSYLLWESDRTWETMPDWGQLYLRGELAIQIPATRPASTPVGDTFTFQEGFLGYSGGEDASISQWYPDINYGGSYTLTVRGDSAIGTLLQYDLSALPDDIAIKRATLSLYPQDRSNPQALDASVYPLLRGWAEAQATWQQASNGNAWQIAGADGVTDREGVAADHKIIDWLQFWASFDLTELVQRWVDGGLTNNGVVVKQIGGPAVGYDFTSRDVTHWQDTPYRPELIVSYWNATPTVTPTATPSPTITPTPTPPCLDAYEPDDTWQQAKLILVDGATQQHNFHQPGDVDYVKFGVAAGAEIALYTSNLAPGVDTTLTLYDSDGVTQLAYNDIDPANPPASRIDWTAPASGTYFLKAAHFNSEAGGCDMTYELAVVRTDLTPTPVSLYLPLIVK